MPSVLYAQSVAPCASLLIKASCGALIECYVTAASTPGYLMLFDAVLPPAAGPVAPLHCIAVAEGTTAGVCLPAFPEPFYTGLVAVFSTTGPFVLTPDASAFIKGVAY